MCATTASEDGREYYLQLLVLSQMDRWFQTFCCIENLTPIGTFGNGHIFKKNNKIAENNGKKNYIAINLLQLSYNFVNNQLEPLDSPKNYNFIPK